VKLSSTMLLSLAVGAGLATAAFAGDGGWRQQVAAALGKPGTEMPGGVYRVALPRTDLRVTLDGVMLKPGFALGGGLAFAQMRGVGIVMGNVVLTAAELNPVTNLDPMFAE
jgi:hypothetical protein